MSADDPHRYRPVAASPSQDEHLDNSHGDRICSATPDLNCDLLRLATSYGGIVAAHAVGYAGDPGPTVGTWQVSRDGITKIDPTP